jgi:hypothetical protein
VKEGFAEAESADQRPPLWSWSGHGETAPRLREKGATVNRTAISASIHVARAKARHIPYGGFFSALFILNAYVLYAIEK